MNCKSLFLSLILLTPWGPAHAAKMECPKHVMVDGKPIPLFEARDALGVMASSNESGSPQVDLGHGAGKEIIDLGSVNDWKGFFPKYLTCDYATLPFHWPPRHHAIVMLPDDVRECVRRTQMIGRNSMIVTSMHCTRPDGSDDGAEVFPSEPLTERTEIGGFRLGMTEAQAQDAAKAKGYTVAEDTVGGETILRVAQGEDGYPMRIVFSATTGTVRQIVVIDPSGNDDDNTMFFRFLKRFGPGNVGGTKVLDQLYQIHAWYERNDYKAKIAIHFWSAHFGTHGPKELRLSDISDPASRAEVTDK